MCCGFRLSGRSCRAVVRGECHVVDVRRVAVRGGWPTRDVSPALPRRHQPPPRTMRPHSLGHLDWRRVAQRTVRPVFVPPTSPARQDQFRVATALAQLLVQELVLQLADEAVAVPILPRIGQPEVGRGRPAPRPSHPPVRRCELRAVVAPHGLGPGMLWEQRGERCDHRLTIQVIPAADQMEHSGALVWHHRQTGRPAALRRTTARSYVQSWPTDRRFSATPRIQGDGKQ
jgi:hypothetical protein